MAPRFGPDLLEYSRIARKEIKRILRILFVLSEEPRHVKIRGSVLLTDSLISCIAKGFKFGQLFAFHRLEWDRSINRPKLSKCSKGRKYCWYFNIALCVLFYAFGVSEFLRFRFFENGTSFQKLSTTLILYFGGVIPCNQIALLWKGDQIPGYVTSYMNCFECFERQYIFRQSESPKILKYGFQFFIWFFYGSWAIILMMLLYFMLNPGSPGFPASLIMLQPNYFDPLANNGSSAQNGHTKDVSAITISLLCWAYYGLNGLATYWLIIFSDIPIIFMSMVVLTELSSKSNKISRETVRTWDTKLRIYLQINLIWQQAQDIYGIVASYTKTLIGSSFVFSAYLMIKLKGVPALTLTTTAIALECSISLFVAFYTIATFYTQSRGLVEEWKQDTMLGKKRERKLKTLQLKAIHPIKIYLFGNSYYVDKEMVATMNVAMLDSLVNTLILYP